MRKTLESRVRGRMSGAEMDGLRREGFIPASISIRGEATRHCSVSREKLASILRDHGQSAIIELRSSDGMSNGLVISRDLQRDHLGDKIIHVGFQGVSAKIAITAEVRVSLVGRPDEVRTGACRVELVAPAVLVHAQPDKIPSMIELDVSAMVMGDVLRVSDIVIGDGYTVVSLPEVVVAVLHSMTRVAPQQDETAEPASA